MNRLENVGFGKIAAVATCAIVVFFLTTSGQEMFSAGPLHAQPRKAATRGGVGSHAEITSCSDCHASPFTSETMADRCMVCHDNIRDQLDGSKPMHGKFLNGQQCTDCHTEHKGPHAALTNMAHFAHSCTAFPLTGKHAQIDDCARCHADKVYQGTPQACASCHAGDDVHKGKRGLQCGQCHSPDTWKPTAVKMEAFTAAKFDHDSTGFKLTGKHVSTDCKSCHVNNTFKGTPQSCVSCHARDEVRSHKDKFGTDCISCHTTTTWKSATLKREAFAAVKFNHDTTAFKLTGKHASADCKSCHVNNAFKGTSQSCVSCHAQEEIKSHKGKFGTDCQSCHITLNWKSVQLNKDTLLSVKFDHDQTAFKLTGKHKAADCKSCHVSNTFKGTAQTCVSCHAEPPSHKPHPQSFGPNCVQCHTTVAWKGATKVAKHLFPINHGAKKIDGIASPNKCSLCHPATVQFVATAPHPSYASYTCYGCHHHTREKEMKRGPHLKHVAEGKDIDKCATCHKTTRRAMREAKKLAFSAGDDHHGCPEMLTSLVFGACPNESAFEMPPCCHETHGTRLFPAALVSVPSTFGNTWPTRAPGRTLNRESPFDLLRFGPRL